MREYYVFKSQSHNPDTPKYMEALSGENMDEYFKEMDDEIQCLMRRDKWDIVSRKSVSDHNLLPGTCSFECKRKTDWKISKFKSRYCVRGDIQNRLSPKPLNVYQSVVQWAKVRLVLILQCILVLQSQSIDFINSFAQEYIPSGQPVFIELSSDFNSDGGKDDVVLKLKKSLCGQVEAAGLWYEKLLNGLLDRCFVDQQGGSLPVHF